MNKTETAKVMAMLSAYYGQGKSDTEVMINAWHLILKDYTFGEAERAVVEFAKNDERDYASFPTPGKIVAIMNERRRHIEGLRYRVYSGLLNGTDYKELSADCKGICSEEWYRKWLKEKSERLLTNREQILTELENTQRRLAG